MIFLATVTSRLQQPSNSNRSRPTFNPCFTHIVLGYSTKNLKFFRPWRHFGMKHNYAKARHSPVRLWILKSHTSCFIFSYQHSYCLLIVMSSTLFPTPWLHRHTYLSGTFDGGELDKLVYKEQKLRIGCLGHALILRFPLGSSKEN